MITPLPNRVPTFWNTLYRVYIRSFYKLRSQTSDFLSQNFAKLLFIKDCNEDEKAKTISHKANSFTGVHERKPENKLFPLIYPVYK